MMLSAHISKMIIRLRNQNFISNPALEEIKNNILVYLMSFGYQ